MQEIRNAQCSCMTSVASAPRLVQLVVCLYSGQRHAEGELVIRYGVPQCQKVLRVHIENSGSLTWKAWCAPATAVSQLFFLLVLGLLPSYLLLRPPLFWVVHGLPPVLSGGFGFLSYRLSAVLLLVFLVRCCVRLVVVGVVCLFFGHRCCVVALLCFLLSLLLLLLLFLFVLLFLFGLLCGLLFVLVLVFLLVFVVFAADADLALFHKSRFIFFIVSRIGCRLLCCLRCWFVAVCVLGCWGCYLFVCFGAVVVVSL